jgi:ABC-type dipeptide/oligopeptide/nickel transport system permease subunit
MTAGAFEGPVVEEIAARSPLELFWRRLKRDRVAMTALVTIIVLIVAAIFAPLVVKIFGAHPPNVQNTKVLDSFGQASGPQSGYPFGTDDLGRDVFSRVVYGARVSLEVAFIATGLILIIGVTIGMIAGYYRGRVDTFFARSIDIVLAFPVLLLALGFGAACAIDGCLKGRSTGVWLIWFGVALMALPVLYEVIAKLRGKAGFTRVVRDDWLLRLSPGIVMLLAGLVCVIAVPQRALVQPGLPVVIFVIVFSGWPYLARIIRGQVLSLREKEFIEAAQSLGASDARIIFKHILPNLIAPIIVYATLLIPANILYEAALSFLGVGVVPPTPSWGAMLSDAATKYSTEWWYMTFPGVALLVTVLAFNLVGDGLQDALNPRSGQ